MVNDRDLDRLEQEMQREEEEWERISKRDVLEASIIDIPEVTDIQENTVWIVSEEVRVKVVEAIKSFPGGQDFIAGAKIKIA